MTKNTTKLSTINNLINIIDDFKERLMREGSKVEVKKRTIELQNINMPINSKEFLDLGYDEYEFQVEYAKVLENLSVIVEILKQDKYSRQCLISNWNLETKPCASLLHFLYRKDTLDLKVFIRSSDILRLPYDIVSLSHILQEVCDLTELKMGKLHLFISSLHMYF